MRTLSAGMTTLLTGGSYDVHVKVEIEDHLGALQDLSAEVVSVSYGETVDELVNSATVVLRRGSGASSLAPLMTADPPVYVGRDIVVSTATVAVGATPVSGDYVEVFRGLVDATKWPERWRNEVALECRDLGGKLWDTWIESEATYTAGTALETVMQSILTAASTGVTLYVPVATSAVLAVAYEQQREPVLQALRTLAETIGWTVRYRWDGGTSAWRLTLYEPSRAKAVADFTFGTGQYYDVSQMEIDVADIRNVVALAYTDTNDERKEITPVEDATSITQYGGVRRYMRIEEASDSPIRNSTQGTALATAALSDLKDPDAVMEIVARYFWPGEVTVDLYGFTANDVHFSSDQSLAPTSISHTIAVGRRPESRVQVRGKPTGGQLMWRRRASRSGLVTAGLDSTAPAVVIVPKVDEVAATASASVVGNSRVASVKIAASTSAFPSAATVRAATAVNGQVLSSADLGTLLSSLTANTNLYFAAFGYTGAGGAGEESVLAKAEARFGVGSSGLQTGSVLAAKLATDAVERDKILNGAVNDLKLAALAVTNAKLALNAVDTANIVDSAVSGVKVATGAITTTKIDDNAITTPKLAALSVEAGKLAAGAVVAGKISAGAIDATSLIANGIITNDLIATGTIQGAKIAATTITGANIAGLTITAGLLSAGAVTAGKIDVGAINAANLIVDGTITAAKLNVTSLSAIVANLGTVTVEAGAGKIQFKNAGNVWAELEPYSNLNGWGVSWKAYDESSPSSFKQVSWQVSGGVGVLGMNGQVSCEGVRISNNDTLELGAKWSLRKGTDADANLDVLASGTVKFYLQDVSGDAISVAGQWVDSSDRRLKTKLRPIGGALDAVRQLTGYHYERKDTGRAEVGLVAQELQAVLPEAVRHIRDADGEPALGIAYGRVTALLVEAIKELDTRTRKAA